MRYPWLIATVFASAGLLASTGQAQTIYQCKDAQGRTVFTDVACSDNTPGENAPVQPPGSERPGQSANHKSSAKTANGDACNRAPGHAGFIDRARVADDKGPGDCKE